MSDDVDAIDRKARRVSMAIVWVAVGMLLYFVVAILVLRQVRLPSSLPPWSMVFFLPPLAAGLSIPVLRIWRADLRVAAAKAQLRGLKRSIDDLEAAQNSTARHDRDEL